MNITPTNAITTAGALSQDEPTPARIDEGEYIAATEAAPFPAREQTRAAFAVAEARLRAAHRVVAEHIDARFARRHVPPAAEGRSAPVGEASAVAQDLREDIAQRQRRLSERLAEQLQEIAASDLNAAADIGALAGEAAAFAGQRRPRGR